MKNNKAYVIFEKGFEYNDEVYSETESGGGNPQKVTFSKEDAKKLVMELNRKELRGCDIRNYTYDLDDLCDPVKLKAVFEKNGWQWDDEHYDIRVPNDATDAQVDEISKMVSLSFYDYQEVDLDMTSFRDRQIDSAIK